MNRSTIQVLLAICLCAISACKPAQPEGSKNSSTSGSGNAESVVEPPAPPGGEGLTVVDDKPDEPLWTVSGTAVETRSYCGGAAPSEAILQKFRMPIPVSGMKFYVRKGDSNDLNQKVTATCVTDAEGKFTLQLPEGAYCLVNEERLQMPDPKKFTSVEYLTYNAECQSEWIQKCDLSFVVGGNNLGLDTLRYHKRCFVSYLSPCIQYRGPMPP